MAHEPDYMSAKDQKVNLLARENIIKQLSWGEGEGGVWFRDTLIAESIIHVAVPGRNQTLFRCVFRPCLKCCSAVLPLRAGLICAM